MNHFSAPFSNEHIERMQDIEDYHSHHEDSELIGMLMSEALRKGEGRVAPDPIGAERFFLEEFITEEMHFEFETIACEFLKHSYGILREVNDVKSFKNIRPGFISHTDSVYNKVLDLMLNAAKAGDEYAASLIRYLYKTYHKREYKQLKRFSSISPSEILSLSDYNGSEVSYETMGRILVMCSLFGITLKEDCSFLYVIMNRKWSQYDEWDEEEIERPDLDEDRFRACLSVVDEWLAEDEKKKGKKSIGCEKYWDIETLANVSFRKHGFPDAFDAICDTAAGGLRFKFTRCLWALRAAYPDREFSFEDVQLYSHITDLIDTFTNVVVDYDYLINCLLRIENPDEEEFEEALFHPEQIQVSAARKAPEKKAAVQNAPVSYGKAEEKDYLSEISDLRQKLHLAEQDKKHYRECYDELRNEVKMLKSMSSKNDAEHEELIALRNYVHSLSAEEEPQDDAENIGKMQAALRERKVVLIGGYIGWINKLKKVFPDWTYVDTNNHSAVGREIVNDAEMVYFFTDYISHNAYGKFISTLRENRIAYSYLHKVNIGELTKQIYKDLCEG